MPLADVAAIKHCHVNCVAAALRERHSLYVSRRLGKLRGYAALCALVRLCGQSQCAEGAGRAGRNSLAGAGCPASRDRMRDACGAWLPILLAALAACVAVPALQPELRNTAAAAEPSSGPSRSAGPPLDYFDLDSWLASDESSPLAPQTTGTGSSCPTASSTRPTWPTPRNRGSARSSSTRTATAQLWDSTLGGRVGLLRFGTLRPAWPQGWQFDVEGSAQVRLDPDENLDLRSVDYRIGAPLTYGYGRHRLKLGYYHLCSHLGDEFLSRHIPTFRRVNFVRDAVTLGYALLTAPTTCGSTARSARAFYTDVSQEWELQFGFDYAPAPPTGIRGAPSSPPTATCAKSSTTAATSSCRPAGPGAATAAATCSAPACTTTTASATSTPSSATSSSKSAAACGTTLDADALGELACFDCSPRAAVV